MGSAKQALHRLGVALIVALISALGAGVFSYVQGMRRQSAELEQLRAQLTQTQSEADTLVKGLRLMDSADDLHGAQRRVLEDTKKLARLRATFDQARADRRGVAARLSENEWREHKRQWDQRQTSVRNIATAWLTSARLKRVHTIPIPAPPKPGRMPVVAGRPDGQEYAVIYPGERTIHRIGPEGQQIGTVTVAEELARKALVTKQTERQTATYKETLSYEVMMPYRLEYVGNGQIEYQVWEESFVWNLTGGEPTSRKRPTDSLRTMIESTNDTSERFIATSGEHGSIVTLRELAEGSEPRVVWQAREVNPKDREILKGVVFGPDGRSLFVRSNLRLALIDAETGQSADVSLEQEPAAFRDGGLTPVEGGVIMVKLGKAQGKDQKSQLLVWEASLPQVGMRTSYLGASVRALVQGNDGLFVVASDDHLVRGWRGRQPGWVSGIPYLGADVQKAKLAHLPGIELSDSDLTPQLYESSGFSLARSGRQRFVWNSGETQSQEMQGYAPPTTYPTWLFLPGDPGGFWVERVESLGRGRSRLRPRCTGPMTVLSIVPTLTRDPGDSCPGTRPASMEPATTADMRSSSMRRRMVVSGSGSGLSGRSAASESSAGTLCPQTAPPIPKS